MTKQQIQNYWDSKNRDKKYVFQMWGQADREKWEETRDDFQEKYVEVYGETFPERNRKSYEMRWEKYLDRLNDPYYC